MDRDAEPRPQLVRVRPYPAADRTFAADVNEAVETVASAVTADQDLADLVQERLRGTYPNAIVRLQQPLAKLLDPVGTVYAYRDGRIRPEDPGRERLYRALGDARTIGRESDRLMKESDDIAGHWRQPRDGRAGRVPRGGAIPSRPGDEH